MCIRIEETLYYSYCISIVFPLCSILLIDGFLNCRQQHNTCESYVHPKYVYTTTQVVNHAPYYYHVTETNLPAVYNVCDQSTQMSLDHRSVRREF